MQGAVAVDGYLAISRATQGQTDIKCLGLTHITIIFLPKLCINLTDIVRQAQRIFSFTVKDYCGALKNNYKIIVPTVDIDIICAKIALTILRG